VLCKATAGVMVLDPAVKMPQSVVCESSRCLVVARRLAQVAADSAWLLLESTSCGRLVAVQPLCAGIVCVYVCHERCRVYEAIPGAVALPQVQHCPFLATVPFQQHQLITSANC